ncbi:MAG: 30S ribosomal protein S4, partial [Weissella cibaria]
FNKDEMKGSLVRLPERSELDHDYNENLIVEYYNKLG